MKVPEQQAILLLSSSHWKHNKYLIQLLYEMVFSPWGAARMEIHHFRFVASRSELENTVRYYSVTVSQDGCDSSELSANVPPPTNSICGLVRPHAGNTGISDVFFKYEINMCYPRS